MYFRISVTMCDEFLCHVSLQSHNPILFGILLFFKVLLSINIRGVGQKNSLLMLDIVKQMSREFKSNYYQRKQEF